MVEAEIVYYLFIYCTSLLVYSTVFTHCVSYKYFLCSVYVLFGYLSDIYYVLLGTYFLQRMYLIYTYRYYFILRMYLFAYPYLYTPSQTCAHLPNHI